ncbi:MAG: hypothetical protein HC859_07385 [Bacteroidia bacterium]|nr:hypothetical protein [Bacteroidia bacterium]
MSAILSCDRRDDEPTFKDYHTLFVQPQHDVWRLFNAISRPEPVAALQLDSGWVYWKGNATEGLDMREQVEAGVPVTLPHRVQLPDTPLWYTNTAQFAEPGYLLLSADDGAQLYVNGTRIARDTAGAFMVPVAERVRLTVRVLNNAMSGRPPARCSL